MKLGLNIKTSLNQTLTPQQIQYLKLLQLPVIQLEQHVKQQIESNPMLEEDGLELEFESLDEEEDNSNSTIREEMTNQPEEAKYIDEESDPFEFQKLLWDGVKDSDHNPNYSPDDDDGDDMPYRSHNSESEELLNQLRMLNFTQEQYILGDQIIGNIDADGYLRRDLEEIVEETNKLISELNFREERKLLEEKKTEEKHVNPAKQFQLSSDENDLLHSLKNKDISKRNNGVADEITETMEKEEDEIRHNHGIAKNILFDEVNLDDAENVLYHIRHLDPPGIGSRNIKECLLSQLDTVLDPSDYEDLAYEMIRDHYDKFSKKHYSKIMEEMEIDEDILKKTLDVIRGLNPKPGGFEYQQEMNSVTPDYVVTKEEETGEFLISLNDSTIPQLRLNKAYEKMREDVRKRKYNKDTRDWIRKKHDDAKFLIQAVQQRKNTMVKVMTAIVHLQKEFFEIGEDGVNPLIYKTVAEETGLDISTVCRIVNGKYVRTDFGTKELKYFFSESLPTDEGEEVSTRIIKNKLKEVIEKENKQKPYSDLKLSKIMNEKGYHIARRTISKYREQLKIPVARLRKELA